MRNTESQSLRLEIESEKQIATSKSCSSRALGTKKRLFDWKS
jgi:hypothetical protein